MSVDNDNQHGAILEFVSTFPHLSEPPTHISDLACGVALFEVLSEIAPDHFDPTTIARHLGDNWALKSTNIRKLIRNLETYYHEVLEKDADFKVCVDSISAISKNSSSDEIVSLSELVVAAAVLCPERHVFVQRIMDMSPGHQGDMKDIIERSLERLKDYQYTDGRSRSQSGAGTQENEMVFEEESSDVDLDSDTNTPGSFKIMQNLSPMDSVSRTLDNHLFSSHSYQTTPDNYVASISSPPEYESVRKERDELRRCLQDARRELAAQMSQAALTTEEGESTQKKLGALANNLQERLGEREIDLESAEDKISKLNRTVEDLQGCITDLSEKNALLADDLDLATGKAAQLRKAEATVVSYRRKLENTGFITQQMTELEDQIAKHMRTIVYLENEVKALPVLQKRVDDLQVENSKATKEKAELNDVIKTRNAEVRRLKDDLFVAEKSKTMFENELYELREQQMEGDSMEDDVGNSVANLSLASARSISDTKERALRLEIENKRLREEIVELQTSSPGEALSSKDVKALKVSITRLKNELTRQQAEKEKLINDKEKLEVYTKKTLTKFQEKYLAAFQECKGKLKDKHQKIEALESRSKVEKTAQKREERLLSSVIYELGLSIMQQQLKDKRGP